MEADLLTLYLMWCWDVRVMPDMEEMLMMEPVCVGTGLEADGVAAAESKGRKATAVKKWLQGGQR